PGALRAAPPPAARPPRGAVGGGHAEKIAAALGAPPPLGHPPADLELARALDLVGLDDGGLGGGAAHVDADHVALADAPGQGGGGDDAGGGARLDHVHGAVGAVRRGPHAAVALHGREGSAEAGAWWRAP